MSRTVVVADVGSIKEIDDVVTTVSRGDSVLSLPGLFAARAPATQGPTMDGTITLRIGGRRARTGVAGAMILAGTFLLAVIGINVAAFHLGSSTIRHARAQPALTPSGTRPSTNDPQQGGAAASRPAGFLDRTIRVLLSPPVSSVRIGIDAPFNVVDPDEQRVLLRCEAAPDLTVRFDGDGVRLLEFSRAFSPRVVDLVPTRPARIRLSGAKGVRHYAGALRFIPQSSSTGVVINVVDIELYLLGVVPAEALSDFHEQAMRAQAIVARTFAWYTKLTAGLRAEWDVDSNESSQMYVGLPRDDTMASRAVRDTAGLVCTWDSPSGQRIFCTYYSSTCGGSTQDAGPVKNNATIKPLSGGVKCDYCRSSPFYSWQSVRLEKWLVTQRLRDKYAIFRGMNRIEEVEVIDSTPQGRPIMLMLIDANGKQQPLEAENFRLSVDPTGRKVKSTFFVPVMEKDAIILTQGRGFGHGIGMCQYGADYLATNGWAAGDILRFYYPGMKLTRAY